MQPLVCMREKKREQTKTKVKTQGLTLRLDKKIQENQEAKQKLLSSRSRSPSPRNPYFTGQPYHIPEPTNTLVNDIKNNCRVQKNHRKLSPKIMSLFALAALISFPCYTYLASNLLLPHYNTLNAFMKQQTKLNPDKIISLDNLNDICENYREDNDINKSIIIPGVLAVDALSLDPYIKVDNTGNVTGIIGNIKLSSDDLSKVKNVVKEQEELIKRLKNITINSAFVYQFQPINSYYRCFTVYVQSATSGKATQKQVETLYTISKKLKQMNFSVFSFASDGDPMYHKLITDNVKRWNCIKERPILNFGKHLYISDPLHIIKRGRYKLLTHNVRLLQKDSELIQLNSTIKEILNLPTEILDRSRIAKMHDDLPIRLFSLKNLDLLLQLEMHSMSAYFIPYSLLIVSLSDDALTNDQRVDFLEIVAYYLCFYKDLMEKSGNVCLQQGNTSCVVMFDRNIADDMISTCISINSFINLYKGNINLNRLGSNPIEHHFGLMRLKAKFKHTFDVFIKNEYKIKLMERIESEIVHNLVNSRRSSFGCDISVNGEIYGSKSIFSNQDIAYSILETFNLPVKNLKYKLSKSESFYAFKGFLKKISDINKNNVKKCNCAFNSRDISHSCCRSCGIRSRQDNQKILRSDKNDCECQNDSNQ